MPRGGGIIMRECVRLFPFGFPAVRRLFPFKVATTGEALSGDGNRRDTDIGRPGSRRRAEIGDRWRG